MKLISFSPIILTLCLWHRPIMAMEKNPLESIGDTGFTVGDTVYSVTECKLTNGKQLWYGTRGRVAGPAVDDATRLNVNFEDGVGETDVLLTQISKSNTVTAVCPRDGKTSYTLGEIVYSRICLSGSTTGKLVKMGTRGRVAGTVVNGAETRPLVVFGGRMVQVPPGNGYLGRLTDRVGNTGFKFGEIVYNTVDIDTPKGKNVVVGTRGTVRALERHRGRFWLRVAFENGRKVNVLPEEIKSAAVKSFRETPQIAVTFYSKPLGFTVTDDGEGSKGLIVSELESKFLKDRGLCPGLWVLRVGDHKIDDLYSDNAIGVLKSVKLPVTIIFEARPEQDLQRRTDLEKKLKEMSSELNKIKKQHESTNIGNGGAQGTIRRLMSGSGTMNSGKSTDNDGKSD